MATLTFHNESTVSAWEQIAGLKMKLRGHLEFFQHRYRGRCWYVVTDSMANNQFRCSEESYLFLRLLDGNRTLQQAWQELDSETEQPDQEEIIRLLLKLAQVDLLQGDLLQNDAQRAQRARVHKRQQGWQRLLRPFAIRIPLLDPDKYLEKLLPPAKYLFTRTTLILWILLVGWVLLTSLNLWPELKAHWAARFLDTGNLIWLWLLYPIVKGLHELGHALATKYWGGEVHEMGIMLLVFMPVPYVDASASTAFYHKQRRMLVSGMGIMVELFLTACALLLWQWLDTGLAKNIAFNIAVIGGMSTLLFNGNPLLRFDGYYLLSDLIEIPNLGSGSNQYLGYLAKRYLFDMRDSRSPVQAKGERPWFICYAILSGIYRLFISFSIALYIAGKFFVVGVLLAFWALYTQIILPAYNAIAQLLPLAQRQNRRQRVLEVLGCAVMFVCSLLFLLPITHSSYTKGIIMLPEHSYLRAESDGFIQTLAAQEGQAVKQGELLIQLENNQLQVELESNRAKQMELQARHSQALNRDPLTAGLVKDELLALETEYRELLTQQERLRLTSPIQGTLALGQSADLPGRFIRKGQILGHVVDKSGTSARVVVEQKAVDLVRRHTQSIEVRLASNPAQTLKATAVRELPSATNKLPSRLLGSQAGGSIAVDARDPDGIQAINKIFQFEVSLPRTDTQGYLGQSVAVRFIHQREPLGAGWYRQIRELILDRFQV